MICFLYGDPKEPMTMISVQVIKLLKSPKNERRTSITIQKTTPIRDE